MTYNTYRRIPLYIAIGWALTGALMCICMARAELPPGMHLMTERIIVNDTLWTPAVTPYTAALNSMAKLSSERVVRNVTELSQLMKLGVVVSALTSIIIVAVFLFCVKGKR